MLKLLKSRRWFLEFEKNITYNKIIVQNKKSKFLEKNYFCSGIVYKKW